MQNFKAGLSKALNSREDSLRAGTCLCLCLTRSPLAQSAPLRPQDKQQILTARVCRASSHDAAARGHSLQVLPCPMLDATMDAAEVAAKAATTEGSSAASATTLQELNSDKFWPFMKEADEAGKLVVVDFYTDW